jgi:iron complex outermembrane receptor protein
MRVKSIGISKTILFSTVALFPLATSAAFGQSVATATDRSSATANGEIVVTARKRVETLLDVPMSVSAITGIDLDKRNVDNVTNLYGRVPGLFQAPGSANNTSDFTYLTIRGVGFNAGLEPAVGIFVDGMYQPQVGFDTAFLDLERVEVLRGPQGTLFGRNSEGGAVNMVTVKPGDTFQGKMRVEGGSFGTLRVDTSLRGPIGNGFSAGVTGEYARTDGYVHNITLDTNQNFSRQYALRATLRYHPDSDLDIVLVGDATHRDYNELILGVPLAAKKYESLIDQDRPDHKDNYGVQLNADYKLGHNISLTSITGYRVSKSDVFTDNDNRVTPNGIVVLPAYAPLTLNPVPVQGATTDINLKQRFWSQEFRLSGNSRNFDWLAGLYYFNQRQDQGRLREVGPGVAFPFALYIAEQFADKRNGYAAFGQASWRPIDRVELTGGVRYSKESVTASGLRVTEYQSPPGPPAAPFPKNGHTSFDNVSFMGSAKYKFSPNAQIYATVAQGWKAGGINRFPSNSIGVLPYKDEKSINYELGVKTDLMHHMLSFNGALYWIDLKNQQEANFGPDPNGGLVPVNTITNAAKARVKGFEIETALRPIAGLEIAGAVSYSDSRFLDFVRVASATDAFVLTGHHFENVPTTTADATVSYTFPISANKKIELFGEYRYIGAITYQNQTLVSKTSDEITEPAYGRFNIKATLVVDGGWRFSVYCNNVFDKFNYNYINRDPFTNTTVFVTPLPPRAFGGVLSKTF